MEFREIKERAEEFAEKQFGRRRDRDKEDWLALAHKQALRDALSYVGRFGPAAGTLKNGGREKLSQALQAGFSERLTAGAAFSPLEGGWVEMEGVAVLKPGELDYRLGVVQKYVNMMFKYLYCIQLYCGEDHWMPREGFAECHCPIDTQIARSLFRAAPRGTVGAEARRLTWELATSQTPWSRIGEEDYEAVQTIVRDFCRGVEVTGDGAPRRLYPLEFDILFWKTPL